MRVAMAVLGFALAFLAMDGLRILRVPVAVAQPMPAATDSPAPAPNETPVGTPGGEAAEDGEPMGTPEAVIPPGYEELLADMLGRGVTLPGDCKLTAGEVDRAVVKATYGCPGGEVVFELAHPDRAAWGATQTERFAITVRSGSPPAELTPALASRIRAREAAFEWKLLARPASRSSLTIILLAAAGVVGLAVVGWVLRGRMAAGGSQPR